MQKGCLHIVFLSIVSHKVCDAAFRLYMPFQNARMGTGLAKAVRQGQHHLRQSEIMSSRKLPDRGKRNQKPGRQGGTRIA
jgi:hypothetical protein